MGSVGLGRRIAAPHLLALGFAAGLAAVHIWHASRPRLARLLNLVDSYMWPKISPPLSVLSAIDCILFDCDGVLYRGKTALPGASQALTALRSAGLRLIFITNNATISRVSLAGKLTAMGFDGVSAADCVTSASAAAAYLARCHPHVKRVYIVAGGNGLPEELALVGVETVGAEDAGKGMQERLVP